MMLTRMQALCLGHALLLGGISVLSWTLGMLPTVAILALIWAHNIEYHVPVGDDDE